MLQGSFRDRKLLNLMELKVAERQLTINPLSCEEQQRVRGVKWPPSHFAR